MTDNHDPLRDLFPDVEPAPDQHLGDISLTQDEGEMVIEALDCFIENVLLPLVGEEGQDPEGRMEDVGMAQAIVMRIQMLDEGI